MPLYEYKCESCLVINEIHHRISAPAPEACPSCQQGPLRKIISQTAFVLKGSGWYTDGYSSKTSDSKNTGTDSSTKTETKPDSSNTKATDTTTTAATK